MILGIAADNDYKLKHLVEVFGLSGDLLNAAFKI